MAGLRDAPDTDDVVLPVPKTEMPTQWQRDKLNNLRVAAILVAFCEAADGTTQVVLPERAHHLPAHPGQISFPGGAREPHDVTLADVALREAEEEVGLDRASVNVLGYLRPQWTISGYSMTPVVGFVDHVPELTADPSEVASVFCVPADYLFDTANHVQSVREYAGRQFPVAEIRWGRHRIWGATAHVVTRLMKVI